MKNSFETLAKCNNRHLSSESHSFTVLIWCKCKQFQISVFVESAGISLFISYFTIFVYWRKEHEMTVRVTAYEQQALKNEIKLLRYIGFEKY